MDWMTMAQNVGTFGVDTGILGSFLFWVRPFFLGVFSGSDQVNYLISQKNDLKKGYFLVLERHF